MADKIIAIVHVLFVAFWIIAKIIGIPGEFAQSFVIFIQSYAVGALAAAAYKDIVK